MGGQDDDGARPVAVRLPLGLLRRADALAPRLARSPGGQASPGRLARASVLRWALAVGLGRLEAEADQEGW